MHASRPARHTTVSRARDTGRNPPRVLPACSVSRGLRFYGGCTPHLQCVVRPRFAFHRTGERRSRPSTECLVVSHFWTFRDWSWVGEQATACEPASLSRALGETHGGSVPLGGTTSMLRMPPCMPARYSSDESAGPAYSSLYTWHMTGRLEASKAEGCCFCSFLFYGSYASCTPPSGDSGGWALYLRSHE